MSDYLRLSVWNARWSYSAGYTFSGLNIQWVIPSVGQKFSGLNLQQVTFSWWNAFMNIVTDIPSRGAALSTHKGVRSLWPCALYISYISLLKKRVLLFYKLTCWNITKISNITHLLFYLSNIKISKTL